MKLRWFVFDYVDPELGLTRAQRRAVRARAYNHVIGGFPSHARVARSARFAQLAITFVPATAMFLAFNARPPGGWTTFNACVVVAGQILISWLATAALARWAWRPFVYIALNELGHPVCTSCGHQLRTQGSGGRCPECGHGDDAARLA